jgi:hypothetical protein
MKILVAALVMLTLLTSPAARADNATREASVHFQRGVDLYNDGDFRGALVEFKKAYQLWPRATVLYDIGQTEFQLLDYAAALKTMERYLAETGANAVHRAEVETTLETLRARVGRVALSVDASECDVTVDEQPAGTTPLAQPILVSVGLRRVAVTCAGRPPAARTVEVVAGETVRVALEPKAPAPAVLRLPAVAAAPPSSDKTNPRRAMALGWSVTAVLAAATIGIGAGALVEQSQLEALKQSYPVTRDALDRKASLSLGLSIAADTLGVATLVAAAASTWLTVKFEREQKLRLAVGAGNISVAGRF